VQVQHIADTSAPVRTRRALRGGAKRAITGQRAAEEEFKELAAPMSGQTQH